MRTIVLLYVALLFSQSLALAADNIYTTPQSNPTNQLDSLYILVHGMGGSRSSFDFSTTAVFNFKDGKEEHIYENGHKKQFTFLEYLNDQLELKGHVFVYTLSHPHGNPAIRWKEIGGDQINNFSHTFDPVYFKMAATDAPQTLKYYLSTYPYKQNQEALTIQAIDPITKESHEYYAAYYKDINEETKKIQTVFGLSPLAGSFQEHLIPTGIEVLEGNNWLKQARRDFKKIYATNPSLKKRIAKKMIELGDNRSVDQIIKTITTENCQVSIPDHVVPQDIVFIAHSLGNLDIRQYLTSSSYANNTVKKIISLDGVHLGSDALQIKNLQGGFESGLTQDALMALVHQSEGFRKKIVPALNSLAFMYHLWHLKIFGQDPFTGLPNPISDEDVITAALLLYLGFNQTQDSISSWQMMGLNMGGSFFTDSVASHITDESWKAMDVLNTNSLANQMKTDNFKTPQIQPIRFRFINPRGIPTHEAVKGKEMHQFSPLPYIHLLMAVREPEFQKLPTLQSKMAATLMMMIEPDAYLIQDGSFSVPKYSSEAQGVTVVEKPCLGILTCQDFKSQSDVIYYDMPYTDENIDFLLSDILLVKRLADIGYFLTYSLGGGIRLFYMLPIAYGGARFIDFNLYDKLTNSTQIEDAANSSALTAYTAQSTNMFLSHTTVVRDSINFDRNSFYGKLKPPIVMALWDIPQVRADQFFEKHNQKFLGGTNAISKAIKDLNMGFTHYQNLTSGSMSNGATGSLGSFEVNPDEFLKSNFTFKDINLGGMGTLSFEAFNSHFEQQIKNTGVAHVNDVTGKLSEGPQSGTFPQTYFDSTRNQNFYMNFQGYMNENDELEIYGTIPTMDYQLDPEVTASNPNGTIAIALPGIREAIRPKSITLKTDKTIISGTLDDFSPKHMKYFQFSLNFGPWQDIYIRDDYGHYQIGPLLLAEGQNIITFRGENAAGQKNWQMLRIIRSSTPLLPTALQPEHQKVLNENTVRISVQYNDTQFEHQDTAGKIIYVDSLKVGNTIIPTAQIEQTVTWNTYQYTANLSTTLNLSEGNYDVEVKAHDIYNHTSFGRWSFGVDTTPPSISFSLSPIYRGGTTFNMSFTVTDNQSAFAYDARYYILDNQNQIIVTLNGLARFSMGNQSLNWDGIQHIGPPTKSADGNYRLLISLSDKAGNRVSANCSFILDSTPPKIILAQFNHPVFSRKYPQGLNFSIKMSEAGKAVLSFTQESSQLNYSYLVEVNGIENDIYTGQYTWKFDQDGNTIPDGIYLVKITPIDGIYQQGNPVTLSVTIDRTGPAISNSHVTPLVLANNGSTPYQADLQFTINDDSPSNPNKKVFGNINLIYKQNGQLIQSWNKYPVMIGNNSLHFDLGHASLPKGMYAMKLEITDLHGNTTNVVADVIRDGIPPIINFPTDDSIISDTVTLIGIAQDPDWTNAQDFYSYQVYVAQGNQNLPGDLNRLGPEWKTTGIAVPLANQNDYGKPYLSVRPISQSNPIAYFNPDGFSNGPVTILIVAAENGLGNTAATIRKFQIDKSQNSLANRPAIDLIVPTQNINFTNNQTLAFTVLNGQVPANINIDIFDSTGLPIYHRNFSNIPGLIYFGKPQINLGNELGIFLWQDEKSLHLVFNGDSAPHHFKGNLFGGGINILNHNFNPNEVTLNRVLSFDVRLNAGQSRTIDFVANDSNQELHLSYLLDEDIPNVNTMKLGKTKTNPNYLPAQITLKPADDSILNLNWDGKLQTGGYGPDGSYSIKISASGTNGLGFSQTTSTFNVHSDFNFTLAQITPTNKNIDPFGTMDRITVEFNLNKDSYITAKVYDATTHQEIITLRNNTKYLGQKNNHLLIWNGAYPHIDSQARKVSGNFYMVLHAVPADNPQVSKNILITPIFITSHINGNAVAQLKPIGSSVNYNGSLVTSVLGNNQYSWSLFATGDYYPPKGFNYQLEGSGLQTIRIHPFVPYAGLAHRYFDTVKFKADINIKYGWHATRYTCVLGVCDKLDGGIPNQSTIKILTGAIDDSYINFHPIQIVCTQNSKSDSQTYNCYKVSPVTQSKVNSNNTSIEYTFQNESHGNNPQTDDILEHKIVITTPQGSYLDTIYPLNMNPPCTYGNCTAVSEKGMFKAELNITGTGDQGGVVYFRYNVKIKPEQDITYSRLTNRFYPWYGYVHKSPQDEIRYTYDFSSEFKNEMTLGFLGVKHMNGLADEPGWSSNEDMRNSYSGSHSIELYPQTLAERNQKVSAFQNMYHNFEYKWVTEDATYLEYLEGEHFEFIPISEPIAGAFVDISSPNAFFKTRYMVYTNQSQDMNLKWPITYTEAEKLNNQQILHINEKLKQKDIEVFDLTNPIYQIDLNTVSYLKPNESTRFMQGAVYKDSGYESNKLSQILPLPTNVIQSSVVVTVTGNLAKDVDVFFKKNQLKSIPYSADSPVSAKYSGSFTPVDWSTDLDPVLNKGVLDSKLITFNETGFESYSPDLIFAKEYPFEQQTDLTFTAPYLFFKHDRNNPNSGQILNPNIHYDPWQIKVYDITGSQNTMFDITHTKQDAQNIFNNKFKTKLRLDAVEKRYARIDGKASGPYELMYFDGNGWKSIVKSNQPKSGLLAFWNVSRLNGKVTVALRVSQNNQLTIQAQEVYLGQLIKQGDPSPQNLTVYSPYKRARVHFHPQSFNQDTFVSVTPVQLNELNLDSRPEIYSIGPIAEILPHGPTFNADTRPTLVFLYSSSDIQELSQQGVDVSKLNVYYINANGGLELAANTHSWVTGNNTHDPNGSLYGLYHQITAKLDHFSPYALLEGEIYPKPTLHASQKNARVQSIVIYGQAEKNKKLLVYLDDDPILGDQDIKVTNYSDENVSIGSWILNTRKFGEDYLATLSPSEKDFIIKQRESSSTQNSINRQKEQVLENLWQQEYDQIQQDYLNQLNNAISYTLNQPIYHESSFTTRNITYTYKDQAGKIVTVSTMVLIDPNEFGVGKFTTRNIQIIGLPNTTTTTDNFHHFRSIKAIDYSALSKKIKIAHENWLLRGIRSIEYTTQSDNKGNYTLGVTLPTDVTQNHLFVTYEKTSLAKNRAIAHTMVGYDKDLPFIATINITPSKLNAATKPWKTQIQVQSSEYGKIGINKIDPHGKLIETLFQECEPGAWTNFEWNFENANRDGIYTYSIFAIDESGNSSLPVNGQIVLDRYPPVIQNNDTLKAFNPTQKKFTLNLNINEPIRHYDLRIYDKNDYLVFHESITRNPTVSIWNPSPSENSQYQYLITAYDQGLNSSSITGSVNIDTLPPDNPAWLHITHLNDQFFVQSAQINDTHLAGYALKVRSDLNSHPTQIDLKNIPNFLTPNKHGDRFYYYSVVANDWADNHSSNPVEKAIYSDSRAIFIELFPTQSTTIKQDGFMIHIPAYTSSSLNFYILQHLKENNYRPNLNYSGFVAMPDYYRAAYAYPQKGTNLFDFSIPYEPTEASNRQLTPSQFRLFRHNGSHWIPVTNIQMDVQTQSFKGSVSELGYFVLALPKTELLNDNSGPGISFVRLANNNLIPNDLIITANITDGDTAIDPSGFKLIFDGNSYALSDQNFTFNDGYGRQGTLIINIPSITGDLIHPGTHTITLECKDLAGNISRKTIAVKNIASFAIENPLNYPNPVRGGSTKFSFGLSRAANEVLIRIYTTTGKLIQEINAGPGLVGYNEVPWNVIDRFGQYLANDVYIYVVIARSSNGETQKAKGKLMILQ